MIAVDSFHGCETYPRRPPWDEKIRRGQKVGHDLGVVAAAPGPRSIRRPHGFVKRNACPVLFQHVVRHISGEDKSARFEATKMTGCSFLTARRIGFSVHERLLSTRKQDKCTKASNRRHTYTLRRTRPRHDPTDPQDRYGPLG